jgi:hypothetical protein
MNRQGNSFWLYEIENYFSISAGAPRRRLEKRLPESQESQKEVFGEGVEHNTRGEARVLPRDSSRELEVVIV